MPDQPTRLRPLTAPRTSSIPASSWREHRAAITGNADAVGAPPVERRQRAGARLLGTGVIAALTHVRDPAWPERVPATARERERLRARDAGATAKAATRFRAGLCGATASLLIVAALGAGALTVI